MSTERYRRKADVVVTAWRALLGENPTKNAVVRVMSVAEFETKLGDAGLHNWGGVQKRGLRPDESAVLAANGIRASSGDEALQAARRLLEGGPNEILARDSSPASGPYFTWFWAFASDYDAATKFLQVLVVTRPRVRAVLDHGTPDDLARAMYETHYYEGFHKDDPEANIRDYARNIQATGIAIDAALVDWNVGSTVEAKGTSTAALLALALGVALMRGAR